MRPSEVLIDDVVASNSTQTSADYSAKSLFKMPSATTVVQTISAALAAAGIVAGAAKITGAWAVFVRLVARAIETRQPADIEAAAGAANAVGPVAVPALNAVRQRVSSEQARTVDSIRRRTSV